VTTSGVPDAHDGHVLTSKDVTRQSFTTTSMRRGYDEREVDDFLDQVIDTLRYYEEGGRPGPQAPAPPARPESGELG
jgi:DivIVA domain-containing protein